MILDRYREGTTKIGRLQAVLYGVLSFATYGYTAYPYWPLWFALIGALAVGWVVFDGMIDASRWRNRK